MEGEVSDTRTRTQQHTLQSVGAANRAPPGSEQLSVPLINPPIG